MFRTNDYADLRSGVIRWESAPPGRETQNMCCIVRHPARPAGADEVTSNTTDVTCFKKRKTATHER